MHRWRGARVKLLTEATCLQDAVAPHLERYLLRGRFDVFSTYQCAVSRRTSTGGARDDELAVLKCGGVDLAKMHPARKRRTKFTRDTSFRSLQTTRGDGD